MFLVRIRTGFCAAHRLFRTDLTDSENYALYGKCSSPNGHGHNYDLEIAVAGDADPNTGMVVNFSEIKEIVEKYVIETVDHRNLNLDVDFMAGLVPTAENLAIRFWEILEPRMVRARLHSITIGENDRNIITYLGPNAVDALKQSSNWL